METEGWVVAAEAEGLPPPIFTLANHHDGELFERLVRSGFQEEHSLSTPMTILMIFGEGGIDLPIP